MLNWQSSSEKFNDKAPDYSRFQVFGSMCHYNVLPKGDKLQPRANKVVFLGFAMNQGYKVYDLTLQKTMVSKDVTFPSVAIFPFSLP